MTRHTMRYIMTQRPHDRTPAVSRFRGRGRGVGFRGRGAGMMRGTGPPGYVPKPPFDITLCEPIFPKVKEYDDSFLTQVCFAFSYLLLSGCNIIVQFLYLYYVYSMYTILVYK